MGQRKKFAGSRREFRGHGGVVVSALDYRSKRRWFDAQSLPSCCFFRQQTLPHVVSLHPSVYIHINGSQRHTARGLASYPGRSCNTLSCFILQKPGYVLVVWDSLTRVRLYLPYLDENEKASWQTIYC